MRVSWLILVGISALGCKDPPAATPPAAGSAGSAAIASPKSVTPALPDEHAPSAPHDQAWAESTAKTIQAIAPDLTNVTCAGAQCDATLTATSEDELMKRADALQSNESLKQMEDARGVMLTAPKQKDGKVTMTLHVLFE